MALAEVKKKWNDRKELVHHNKNSSLFPVAFLSNTQKTENAEIQNRSCFPDKTLVQIGIYIQARRLTVET